MSDVTAEEVERERERAHRMLTDARYMPCTHPDHNADCDVFATALAVRAREARREALREAAGVCRLRGQFTMAEAIRALMGRET